MIMSYASGILRMPERGEACLFGVLRSHHRMPCLEHLIVIQGASSLFDALFSHDE